MSVPVPKDAPYFYDLDIEYRSSWEEREYEFEGVAVRTQLQVLDGLVWVAECRYQLTDAFSKLAVARKEAIQTALRQTLQHEIESTDILIEEYTIILLQDTSPTPDEFVNQHASALSYLMRSLTKPLKGDDNIGILSSRARFSELDLTAVDWSGAVIICEEGDFQADIELLKIGKYQLLRYRMLDQTVQKMLQHVRRHLPSVYVGWLPSSNKILQEIVKQRLSLLLDFEKIDQSLLLIGDWYSAQIYQIVVDQFGLDEWKELISTKLDSLAAIDEVVRENLTFSWRRLIDLIILVGWLVLLIGYFILFFASSI
ncbi:MAG: hypothetical protein GY805_11540 [Chloroflexi bacterium]|nr:hypothetical protein [Chloroflexota bacterium]